MLSFPSTSEVQAKLPIGLEVCLRSFHLLVERADSSSQMDLLKRWDGQPVNFVCRTRGGETEFFVVQITFVEETEASHEESEHGVPQHASADDID